MPLNFCIAVRQLAGNECNGRTTPNLSKINFEISAI